MPLFWVSTITILIAASTWLFLTLTSKNDWRLFGPFGVLMICYIYYCAAGPLVHNIWGEMGFRGVDFASNINSSSLAALLSFIMAFLGYGLSRKKGEAAFYMPQSTRGLWNTCLVLYGAFLVGLIIAKGGDPTNLYNILGERDIFGETVDLFGFQTYLYMGMSCMIVPCIALIVTSQGSPMRRIIAFALTSNLFLIFLTTGFRLRIAFTLLALLSIMTLRLRTNPKWSKGYKMIIMSRLAFIGAGALAILVLMSSARQYGKGLDLDKLKDVDMGQIAISPFNDSAIYFCGGAVIDYIKTEGSHTYFETFMAGALRMVPSAIYGEKPIPKTIEVISNAMGGDDAAFKAGFAVPFYVEHYISFGWVGLLIGSMVIGNICARIENIAVKHPRPLAYLFFAIMSAYVFIYFHRGYFPQQLDYLMFMAIIPLTTLYSLRNRISV